MTRVGRRGRESGGVAGGQGVTGSREAWPGSGCGRESGGVAGVGGAGPPNGLGKVGQGGDMAPTEVIGFVGAAHDLVPAGRVLCAAPALQVSQEASTHGRLLGFIGLF